MTVAERGGRYYRAEVTQDALNKKRLFLERLLRFIEDSCTIRGLRAPGPPRLDKLPEVIGAPQAASILLAHQEELPLLADDMALRDVAANDLHVAGFDTSALLRASALVRMITPERLRKELALLFAAGYWFIPLDAGTVWETARLADFAPGPPLARAMDQVCPAGIQETTQAAIVAGFIAHVYCAPVVLPDTTAARLVHAFMDKLVEGRADRRAVVSRVKQAVQSKLWLAPGALQRAMSALRSWERYAVL